MTQDHDDNLARAEDALVAQALGDAGVTCKSVYDLVNSSQPYAEAIPVLVQLLPKVKSSRVKEGIARALTVKAARPKAAQALIKEFAAAPMATYAQQDTKWAIGNALSITADDSVFSEIVCNFDDARHGWTRSMLALALCNMKSHRAEAIEILLRKLDDPDVGVNAMIALGRLRVTEARSGVSRYLGHSDPWVRRHARRAMAKINAGTEEEVSG